MATTTTTKTDEQIQRHVLAELKWDARVQPNEIGVSVKDGVVTLTGWVDSYSKKWAAEEATHRVYGVKAVANDIEVRLPTERTDADIAAAVVQALKWDALLSIDKLDVTVSKGWVTLKGEVEWQFQKLDAEQVVRRLSGVKGVTNLITVKPRLAPSDLKQKIEQASHVSPRRGAPLPDRRGRRATRESTTPRPRQRQARASPPARLVRRRATS